MTYSSVNILAPLSSPYSVESFCCNTYSFLPPFSEIAYDFVDSISKRLLRTPEFKVYPEMVALGFWLRKANIQNLVNSRNINFTDDNSSVVLPRGLVLHVAPSNVDTIFIYSLVISLLMGNKNIVRLSSKGSDQQKLLLNVFNEVLAEKKFEPIVSNLLIITYPHNDDISKNLSLSVDARMIWGGDLTVSLFSSFSTKPTCVDVKFANKYSVSVLELNSIHNLDDVGLHQLAKLFVNDTFLFGQQACSSPRSIFWLGDEILLKEAKDRFWCEVESVLKNFDHRLTASDFVEKLIFCTKNSLQGSCVVKPTTNMLLTLIESELSGSIPLNVHCGRGTFVNVHISDLAVLNSVVNRSVQTLTYFGISKETLANWLQKGIHGFDRIVPVGKGLDFDFIWDGVDLFTSLSRIITIK